MTTKEYLLQLKTLGTKIEHMQTQLDMLKAAALDNGAIDYSKEKVQTSPEGDRLCDAVSRYIDKDRQITAEIDKLIDLRQKIIKELHCMDNQLYMDILFKRYVQYRKYKDLDAIADELGYTGEYMRHLHGWALQEFAKITQNITQ